mgnify:FL=1
MNAKSLYRVLSVVLLGCVPVLTGCDRYMDKTNEKIETTLERAEVYQQQATIPDLPAPVDTVRVQNDIWLGNSSVKIMEGDPLPWNMEKDDSITLVISQSATLPTLVQEITDITGITVRLDDLKAENAMPQESVPVNYSGKLSGLLNYLSNRYGVWWRYKNNVITFFTKETRVFTIYALPTETKMSADLKGTSMGSSGSSSGGGNTSSSLSTSANLALWDSIEKGVQQVVGQQGSLSFSRVAGTVTVTASPFVMQKVASYIANWNEKLSRQVAISVKVLQVSLDNSDNYGLDLSAVFNSNNIAASYVSPFLIDTTTQGAGLLSMTLLRPSSRWKDSKSVIAAFSSQGKTSLVTSSSVTTLNNKVAPVQITTAQNYVKEVNVTNYNNSSSNDSEVDMETDTLNYGFTMEILPRILDHGRLIMLFSMTLSDLLDLETFSSGSRNTSSSSGSSGDNTDNNNDGETTTVQLPKMQSRGFMQEIAMKSGSTLVLTGFEQVSNNINSTGVGKAKMGLLGGSSYNQNKRDVMVILVTPEVLESPMSPEARMREF